LATTREIRRRIRSIRNTAQITKAMETVAGSRMRRAQERVLAARPYAEKSRLVLQDLASRTRPGEALHPLLQQRPVKRVGLVLITADRGLCGGFNTDLIRRASNFILEQNLPVGIIAIGRKGRDFMVRYGRDIIAEFTPLSSQPVLADILPIGRLIISDYTLDPARPEKPTLDQVFLLYTRFISTLSRRPVLQQLLPIPTSVLGSRGAGEQGSRGELPPAPMLSRTSAQKAPAAVDYIYEPSSAGVLDELLPRFVEVQIYQAILESIASEQAARMVAMRNATDNAMDIIDELTLSYNKARQAAITKELIDITTSAGVITR
jgi:F-type H+-transporting ATPase subunit gamma